MKNYNLFRVGVLILLSCISCSEEKNIDENTVNNFSNETCPESKGTCCSIIGRFKVIPGKTYAYTESTGISSPTITWEVTSGLITLISSEGSTAVFKFDSNFTTGQIKSRAASSSSVELCESILEISKE